MGRLEDCHRCVTVACADSCWRRSYQSDGRCQGPGPCAPRAVTSFYHPARPSNTATAILLYLYPPRLPPRLPLLPHPGCPQMASEKNETRAFYKNTSDSLKDEEFTTSDQSHGLHRQLKNRHVAMIR